MNPLLARTIVRGPMLVIALLLTALAQCAFAQSDADFLAVRAAYERGNWRQLDALAPSLAGHPLERYVRYWQIRSRIDDASADAVHAFVARFPDGPLADRLRVEWLKALGKRGDWDAFAADYSPPPAGEDSELSCYRIQYRYRHDGVTALDAAKPLWFNGRPTPDSCEPLFVALIARGGLTLADRLERFRLATAAGSVRLAQSIADDLPRNERITAREFARVDRDPMRAVSKGRFPWDLPSGRELALYALDRAARKDAGEAREGWVKWRGRLPDADRDYGNLRIAWYAARQLNPAANAWFKDVSAITLSPDEQAWRVRAALRVSAWDDVRARIDAMPDAEQQQPAWRYWHARALASQGATDQAQAQYASLAGDVGFYGLLAAEALGRGPAQLDALKSDSVVPDPAALAAFGARADVRRALKLAELDLRQESLREWRDAIRGLGDNELLLAAEFARRAGLYDRAINTAERTATRHDFSLRYLMPFRDEFTAAAREQGLDAELLYGIARQESRFVPDIVSAAGAVGLMQLMPGTARWIAKRMARGDYTSLSIADVDVNTQFGAFYFKYWQDRLDQLPALAAAAYNAGPSRAQAWRPASGSLEGAIWVETIPFNETRDYVKRVLANTMLYMHALNRPYVALTERLGVVTPRGIDAATAAVGSP